MPRRRRDNQMVSLPILAAVPDLKSLKGIIEHEFSVAVREYAVGAGWLVHYQRRSGFVAPDGTWKGLSPAGFPDLVLARAGRVLFAELKTEGGTAKPEQLEWLEALGEYGRFWRPRDSRAIMAELDQEVEERDGTDPRQSDV